MNKRAELEKRAILYVACRGLLRIKQAEDSGSGADSSGDTDAGGDEGAETTDAAEGPRQYTVGDAMRSVGGDLAERAGIDAGWGAAAGDYLSHIGSRVYGGAVNAMANSKNKWLSSIGNFLGKNHETISAGASLAARYGANQLSGYLDQRAYDAAAKQVQDAQANATNEAQNQPSFNADQMFTGLFQNMANMAMSQPGGYQQPQGYGYGYPPQQGYGYPPPQGYGYQPQYGY